MPVGASFDEPYRVLDPGRCAAPASAASASSSCPTQPTSATSAPSRAAATAWFAPLPPGTREKVAPLTVSPGRGSRSACATRSRLIEPTTVSRGRPPRRQRYEPARTRRSSSAGRAGCRAGRRARPRGSRMRSRRRLERARRRAAAFERTHEHARARGTPARRAPAARARRPRQSSTRRGLRRQLADRRADRRLAGSEQVALQRLLEPAAPSRRGRRHGRSPTVARRASTGRASPRAHRSSSRQNASAETSHARSCPTSRFAPSPARQRIASTSAQVGWAGSDLDEHGRTIGRRRVRS